MFKRKEAAMKAQSFIHSVITRFSKSGTTNLLLGALLLGSLSSQALADDLEKVLSNAYPAQSSVAFVKHESIVQASNEEDGSEKYMVLDFKIDNEILIEQQLQASIHSICNTVLTDYSLIEQLSNNGYDMISVSFDAHNQYDCL